MPRSALVGARRGWLLRRATLVLMLSAIGCKEEPPQRGAPPPPPATAKAGVCAQGGGTLEDATSAPFFPRTTGGFCLDPNGGFKVFGDQAPLPLEQICDLFDGECAIYQGFNVRRVVEVRYVDGSGSPATIDVYLSRFGTPESAYAMFTKRVVGEGDPVDEATPKPTEAQGVAALGLGNAYVWRGSHLVEITYSDESAAEAAIRAAGEKLLPPLVKEISSRLPGETQPPAAVGLLPKDKLLPLGVRYVTKDVLGIDGLGGGATGYYKDGDKRWRVVVLARADADQAKDALATLVKREGATKEKGIGESAVRFMHREGESAPPTEWFFARSATKVVGVGDEPRVLRKGMSADETAKVTLTKDEKIERLKAAL